MLKNVLKDIMYIRNPDIVLREEDEDGGMLFNPDTSQIKVINTTGLFIWEQCNGENSIDTIVKNMKNAFDGVPENNASVEVESFLEEMTRSGFIGVLEK